MTDHKTDRTTDRNSKRHPILLTLLLLLVASATAVAQGGRTISYQGLLQDGAGEPVPDGTYEIRLRLYNDPVGGAALYEEGHSVSVVDGLFALEIGSLVPLPDPFPSTGDLYVGIVLDGGIEMSPRTRLTAVPIAIWSDRSGSASQADRAAVADRATTADRAAVADRAVASDRATIADRLAPDAPGVVRSINGVDGDLVLRGGAGTGVTRSGDTLTITAAGGEGGGSIDEVQGIGAIGVIDGDGPIATIEVLKRGIVTNHLADGAVTAQKLEASDPSAGEYLSYDGSELLWKTVPEPAVFPRNDTIDDRSSPYFGITRLSSGDGMWLRSTDERRSGRLLYMVDRASMDAIYLSKTNQGRGMYIFAGSHDSGWGMHDPGIEILSNRSGNAAKFRLGYSGNDTGAALLATTAGEGYGVRGIAFGDAVAGHFANADTNGTESALEGHSINAGSGVVGTNSKTGNGGSFFATGTGNGVLGWAAGSGHGLVGIAKPGHAVYAQGTAYKTVGGNTWSTPSDVRLKTDVVDFTDGLALVEAIRPVSYRYDGRLGTDPTRTEYGVIAQEIAAIAPYMVETDTLAVDPSDPDSERIEVLTYNNGPLTYALVNAVQELAAEVRDIRERQVDGDSGDERGADEADEVIDLRQQILLLESRIAELERLLVERR